MVCAPHYSHMQKCACKDKATVLISGDLGNSHGHGPAPFLSAPISLQVTHQGKSWAPALQRLSPSTLSAFWHLGHCWHCHNGTHAPAGAGVPISEQDSYVLHSPLLKYGQSIQALPWQDFCIFWIIQTSIRLENLGHPSVSFLRPMHVQIQWNGVKEVV